MMQAIDFEFGMQVSSSANWIIETIDADQSVCSSVNQSMGAK